MKLVREERSEDWVDINREVGKEEMINVGKDLSLCMKEKYT